MVYEMATDCYIIYMPYKDPEKRKIAHREGQRRFAKSHAKELNEKRRNKYHSDLDKSRVIKTEMRRRRLIRTGELELIENDEKAKADNFKGWIIHHRLELTINGEHALTQKELKRLKMYYHRPYYELIYLTRAEHAALHGKCKSNLSKQRVY
jgi:hypothetical protein